MSEQEKNIYQEIIEFIIQNINNENLNIQKTEERIKLLNNTFYQKESLHRNRRTCIYPGCTEKSVKKSHTIQRQNVLKTISEDNHVYKPEVDMKSDKPMMKINRLGIKDASTFPGFCSIHEQLFESFEKKGSIDTKFEALLQSYRTICRELVFRVNEKKILLFQRDEYLKNIEKDAQHYFFNELEKKELNLSFKKLSLSLSNIKDYLLVCFDNVIDLIDNTINDLERYMISAINNKDEIVSKEFTINYQFPIAIAGFGNQKYKYLDEKKDFLLILNVIPYKTQTTIIFYTLKEHESIFHSYIKYYTQNSITILNLIESFMINASDHWYIKPSYWDSMSELKKKFILQCLLYTQESFIDECPYSIFDNIRIHFIETFINSKNGVPLTQFEENFLKKERYKLNKKIVLKTDEDIIDGMNKNIFH